MYNGANTYRLEEMLDVIKRSLDYMLLLESETDSASPVVAALLELVQLMDSMIEEEEIQQRGRPRIVIREDQLCFLLENGFRINDIASMFLCSGRTVERRMAELSMRASDFSDIADTDLDQLVERIILVHPQSGEKTVSSQLRSQGYKIQRQRIRDSIRRIDPIGVQLRSRRRLHRRVYQVASPNSLWHLDGYHKLIRWKLVVHGGIDGFSRLIMFLKVSTNNYASTVLSAFVSAVDEFGLPSRIRIDRGGENYLVSQFMLEHIGRGPNRHSVIAGRSVHNQRIERLWRDLYSGCICFFYTFFHFLEDILLLDPDNLLDIYALHFVFLPIIQGQLDTFREGWAHHSLRTERNKTPMQLWILGLSHMHSQNPESAEVNSMDVSSLVCLYKILHYNYYSNS